MFHQVKHESWRDEIGNCIATPRFEFRVGFESRREQVKCIKREEFGNVVLFTVFWKPLPYTKVMENHNAY